VSILEKRSADFTEVLELIIFLEETFHFRVKKEGLVPENLDSVNN
jgi:acyl carrier protein